LSSIFDALVGEVLVKEISHKWAKSPCQQSSTVLLGSACICIQRQTGWIPLKHLWCYCGRLLLLETSSHKGVEDPCQIFLFSQLTLLKTNNIKIFLS